MKNIKGDARSTAVWINLRALTTACFHIKTVNTLMLHFIFITRSLTQNYEPRQHNT